MGRRRPRRAAGDPSHDRHRRLRAGGLGPQDKARRRVVALDERTVTALRRHRDDQERERKAAGPLWHRTGLVFVREDGTAIHPQRFSKWFTRHAQRAGLSSIRLHDYADPRVMPTST